MSMFMFKCTCTCMCTCTCACVCTLTSACIVHTGSRAQTLLPRATGVASIKVLGWSAEAQALLTALGEPIPADQGEPVPDPAPGAGDN